MRCWNYSTLPQEAREALADGLDKMRNNLEEARGFLPLKRGERPESYRRTHEMHEFLTAVAVEHARIFKGLSREDAVAWAEEEFGMTEALIHKRWKRHHKDARESLSGIRAGLESVGVVLPTMPRRKKRCF